MNSNRICNTGIPGATLALLLAVVSPSMPVLAEEGSDYTRHNIGVFLGATNEASGSTESSWRLGIGVGQEEIGGSHSHRETLYRASVAYHFHVGKFALSPLAAVDRVDGDNLYVFGVASSRPF
ncbi:MAG: hypothetical protein V7742_16325 [Halioglobus sp.]